jgi:hypothetical protein
MGLPGLKGHDKKRVDRDNDAAEFILGELQLLQQRGAGSARENPDRSIRWATPTEVRMFNSGGWWDKKCHSCALTGS